MGEQNLFYIYSSFFIGLVAFTLIFYLLILNFTKTLGIRGKNDISVRWSGVSKPSLGGLGFMIAFLISIIFYAILFDPSEIFKNSKVVAYIVVACLAFLMGLADDAYNTRPWLKFFIQFSCGVILIFGNNYIQILPWDWANYLLTVFWVVGIMNSINMLDNMDGITASVSSLILLIMMLYLYMHGYADSFDFFLMLGMLASLVGFLYYNWNPSKMFMGDTGSQFLGVMLAALSIPILWNSRGLDGSVVQSRQFVMVILAFLVPIIDTTVVSINRIRRGQSPFVGGKDHTTHNLSYLGLSDSQVGFIFGGIASVCAFLSLIILRFLEKWNHWMTFAFAGFFALALGVFFYITYYNKKNGKGQG